MTARTTLLFCLGCLVIAALEAPRACGILFAGAAQGSESISAPLEELQSARASAPAITALPRATLAESMPPVVLEEHGREPRIAPPAGASRENRRAERSRQPRSRIGLLEARELGL